ncbi:MAG TPA: hypothetical protein VMN57_07080 [Anaerolineales bacterium]|nr:hypothetical protein [Anaerolineales bacterium]
MQSGRRPIILIAVILFFTCLCLVGAGAAAVSFFSIRESTFIPGSDTINPSATQMEPGETDPPVPATETPASPGESPEATGQDPGSDEDLPAAVVASMETIQDQVIQLRGLDPAEEFTRAIFSPEDMRERVVNDFFADYTPEEAGDDALVLAVFGLLEPEYDLIALYIELFSEQVAGFYDDDTREMVVVGSESFGGPEKLTYAHEYNHALQDQNFDFDGALMYNEDACEADSERCAAIQALIEGDSTLLELEWFMEYATDLDLQQIIEYFNSLDLSVLDHAPAFLQLDFVFPYDQGYLFVESLFNGGGWEAVDAAYADPPVSTEQILHPEKYPGDAPAAVELPDLLPVLGDDWELLDENVMGEWYTYLILGHGFAAGFRLGDEEAAAAAAGWGGDRYAVYHNRDTGATVMALKAAWDTPADALEFAEAFEDYAAARFGPGSAGPSGSTLYESDSGVHLFLETGGTTIWIAAPDPSVAAAMLTAVNE